MANKQEIIKAYRKLAQQWHPDNFQSEAEKKEAEKKFIDIASAKEVLTDPGQETSYKKNNIYIYHCITNSFCQYELVHHPSPHTMSHKFDFQVVWARMLILAYPAKQHIRIRVRELNSVGLN